MWLFLTVPWVGLQCVIVVFPDHTCLLFLKLYWCRYSVDIFSHSGPWVLAESRIPLKPVLGSLIIIALSLVLMNRLNKTDYAVF